MNRCQNKKCLVCTLKNTVHLLGTTFTYAQWLCSYSYFHIDEHPDETLCCSLMRIEIVSRQQWRDMLHRDEFNNKSATGPTLVSMI